MLRKYEAARARQDRTKKVFEPHVTNRKPTEETEAYWIRVWSTGPQPKATERSGKWLLFVAVEKVDEVWAAIKQATEAGQLGPCSKVATMRPNPNAQDPWKKVICVYTYDSDDRADVLRIREALRELGFMDKLAYKTDEATLEGRYRNKGDRGISKYYE
jgi:hypothetical protein